MTKAADKIGMGCQINIIHSHLIKITALACLSLIFVACGKLSSQIEASFKRPSTQDFAKSEIINNGPGIADGQSELLVVIQLMNSDGTSVALFKPTYEIIAGTGVTASACITSNVNGVSTCVLKSVQAGLKRISVTNIPITLNADVLFNQPAGKSLFGLTSASKTQTQSGYKLSATVGSEVPGAIKKSGTYNLYGGFQGEVFSR
jgi:hypothetical protein